MKTFFSFAFILSILLSIPVYSQWQMMNSPLATPDIRKVAYHPDGYILAITSANEVFRSDNNGENWQIVSTLDDEATSLAISPTDIIYAGTYGGYFASTDDGVTWNEKQLFSPVNYVTDIEFNSLGYIFMSQYSYNTAYIWISTDGGNNWNISTNLGSPILSLAKDSSENIYAMTIYGSIYKSSDNGFSWQFLTSIGYYPDDLEIDTNNIFYLADSYDGIYKSTDLGISWSLILETNWPVYFDNIFLDANNNIYGFYISNDSNVFNGIIFSSDGGENWENINLSGIKISDLISENNTIFTGTEKGLQKLSVINSDWELCFKYDDKFAVVYDLIVLPNGKTLAGTDNGLYFSFGGFFWDSTFITSNIRLIKKDYANNIYSLEYKSRTYLKNKLYRSSNEGNNWELSLYLPQVIDNFFINDSNKIFTTVTEFASCLVLESLDFGISWDTISSLIGPAYSHIYGLNQNSVGNLFFSSYYLWVVGPGDIRERKRLMKSENNGLNWQQVRDDLFIKDIRFSNDTMYLAVSNQTYFPSSGGIYKSYDDGYNLIPLNNGLNNFDVKQLILTPDVFICLTGNGIYRSLDNGDYWSPLDLSGLLSTSINSIYYSDEGVLYAATNNGIGVFVGDLPVELLSFTGKAEGQNVILNWSTATELNNHGFEIQRKFGSNDWITIAFKEGKGTSSEQNDYSYADNVSNLSASEIFYRLKQIDLNGSFSYSDEVKVLLNPIEYALYQNYPNPFNPSTVIKYSIVEETKVNLTVFDVLGNEIRILIDERKEPGNYEINFSAGNLASGIYFYRLKTDNFISIKKMMVIR